MYSPVVCLVSIILIIIPPFLVNFYFFHRFNKRSSFTTFNGGPNGKMGNCTKAEGSAAQQRKVVSSMGNYTTAEGSEAQQRKVVSSMGNCTTAETSTAETSKAEFSIILYDGVTGEEYRVVVANQKDAVWSTVNKECSERARRARKITYGGMEIFETQTWEQLGIADDATVIVETEKKQETV